MIECLGALAILTGQGQVCSDGFDARRHGEIVRTCQLAYERLEYSAARLIDREVRTRQVLQGHRGSRRIARFVAVVASENPAAMGEGEAGTATMAVFALTIGGAQEEQPETDPNVVAVAVLGGMAERCDAQLTRWGAPPADPLPDDGAQDALTEFRVNGHSVSETFAHAPTAALARAACDGSAVDVARAVSNGGDRDGAGLRGMTPLSWAITCESLAGIAALLAAGANPNRPIGEFGSPVALAAGYRNAEILRLLLGHGGNPNADAERESALVIAYRMGRFGAGWTNFNSLLDAGADINRRSPDGDTIVDTALAFADYERIFAFLERGYAGDLAAIGRYVTMDEERRGSNHVWLERVKARLQASGVRFPVPPYRAPETSEPVDE